VAYGVGDKAHLPPLLFIFARNCTIKSITPTHIERHEEVLPGPQSHRHDGVRQQELGLDWLETGEAKITVRKSAVFT
jgi:hypothetical protein